MNKFLLSATVAAGMIGATTMAHAGQGNAGMSSGAIVAQTPPNVIGQTYPDFGPPEAPIVTDRFGSAVVGETYPRLIDPSTIRPPAIGGAPSAEGDTASMPRNALDNPNSIVRGSANFQPQMGD